MKLDFGSGFAPVKGWATLDSGANCTFNSIDQIPDNSISKIRFRNVLHHIENMDELFKSLLPKLRKNAKIIIIECRKEFYYANFFLDTLWYRSIIPDLSLYISHEYRDYRKNLEMLGFNIKQQSFKEEKEEVVFAKEVRRAN